MATALFDSTVTGNTRRNIQLVRISAFRALKVRYRGTALGILWSFDDPVLMTAVYTAIFGTAFSKYYDGSVTRYVLSAFIGLVDRDVLHERDERSARDRSSRTARC